MSAGAVQVLALSVQQPWSWLIVNGYKDIENRTWGSNVRGSILLHAGQRLDLEGYDWVRRTFPAIPLPPIAQLERGGIVGRARMFGCVTGSVSPWFFGPFGFALDEQAPLPFLACAGRLGFFRLAVDPAYYSPGDYPGNARALAL